MPRKNLNWARSRRQRDRKRNAAAISKGAVLRQIQEEAKAAGATLKSDGKGGIDPEKALAVFRKAKWRCENPHCPAPNKDLDLDHQSGHPREIFEDPDAWKDPKALRAAKDPDPKDDSTLHVLCAKCHDAVHQRERALEEGKDPPPMPGRKDEAA